MKQERNGPVTTAGQGLAGGPPAGEGVPETWRLLPITLLCLGLLLLSLIIAWRKTLFPDEIECIHTAWKIWKGERIYQDFFQHHHALLYQLLAPIIGLLGESTVTIRALRMLAWLVFLAIVAVSYLCVRETSDRKTALTAAALLLSVPSFIWHGVEVRPDVPQTLFVLLAAYLHLKFLSTSRLLFLRASSLCLFVAFLFLQKTVYVLPAFLLFHLWSVRRGEMQAREAAEYWLWFALATLVSLLLLVLNGGLRDYITYNWLMNYFYKHLYRFVQPGSTVSFANAMKQLFTENSNLFIFAVLALFLPSRDGQHRLIAVLAFFTLSFCILLQLRLPHYYLVSFPFLAMLAAWAIHNLINRYRVVVLLVLLSSAYPVLLIANVQLWRTNAKQFEKIDYVLSLTKAEDIVYDGNVSFNLFRGDLDYFWFQLRKGDLLFAYKFVYDYQYDLYARIMERKPKVVSTFLFDQKEAKKHGIQYYYQPSPKYPRNLLLLTDPAEHPELHRYWLEEAPSIDTIGSDQEAPPLPVVHDEREEPDLLLTPPPEPPAHDIRP